MEKVGKSFAPILTRRYKNITFLTHQRAQVAGQPTSLKSKENRCFPGDKM